MERRYHEVLERLSHFEYKTAPEIRREMDNDIQPEGFVDNIVFYLSAHTRTRDVYDRLATRYWSYGLADCRRRNVKVMKNSRRGFEFKRVFTGSFRLVR